MKVSSLMSLDLSRAKDIVDNYLPRIRRMLYLQDWKITIDWRPIPGGVEARVTCQPGYQRAKIEIDIGMIETEEQLKETLWHEMFHILHSDFETFRKAAFQHIDGAGSCAENAMDEIWHCAVEHLVRRLENVFEHGLHLDLDEALAVSEREPGTELIIQVKTEDHPNVHLRWTI